MTRSGVVVLVALLLASCSTSPSITRTKTTLGEVDMTGLECKRDTPAGSSIARTICATPEDWAKLESEEAARSQAELAQHRSQQDNRVLYRGMRAD